VTRTGVPAFTMIALVWLGVQAEAQTAFVLMLDSVAPEFESDENLAWELSWQKPIYSDDIHRFLRYATGAL